VNRRVKLPVVEPAEPPEATAEVLRRSLGGPLAENEGGRAGHAVELRTQPGRPLVVLLEEGEDVHVWVGQGRVRKVQRPALADHEGARPPELDAIARDIARFRALPEGAPVAFLMTSPPGATGRGVLVERCRFGALVQSADGRLMAVGFRRLWRDDGWIN
jgi:hypothetical protein